MPKKKLDTELKLTRSRETGTPIGVQPTRLTNHVMRWRCPCGADTTAAERELIVTCGCGAKLVGFLTEWAEQL